MRIAEQIASILLELNVLNLDQIDRQLNNVAAYAIYPEIKQWVKTVARARIINLEGDEAAEEFKPYSTKPSIRGRFNAMPTLDKLAQNKSTAWVPKAVAEKRPLHHFNYLQPRQRKFWKTLETIVDWFNTLPPTSSQIKNIKAVTFEYAAEQAKTMFADLAINPWAGIIDNPRHVRDYSNGYRWVQLTTNAHLQREGYRDTDLVRNPKQTYPETSMGHCIATYARKLGPYQYYSLRDHVNNPHCTLEVQGNAAVTQIKGKRNAKPDAKYQAYIVDFIGARGWEIRGDRDHLDAGTQLPPDVTVVANKN